MNTCYKCGTSIPYYASVCSGCTRDVDNGGSEIIKSDGDLLFLIIIGIAVFIAWATG